MSAPSQRHRALEIAAERRGFARGLSIQTVGPLLIAWAEHVQGSANPALTIMALASRLADRLAAPG